MKTIFLLGKRDLEQQNGEYDVTVAVLVERVLRKLNYTEFIKTGRADTVLSLQPMQSRNTEVSYLNKMIRYTYKPG